MHYFPPQYLNNKRSKDIRFKFAVKLTLVWREEISKYINKRPVSAAQYDLLVLGWWIDGKYAGIRQTSYTTNTQSMNKFGLSVCVFVSNKRKYAFFNLTHFFWLGPWRFMPGRNEKIGSAKHVDISHFWKSINLNRRTRDLKSISLKAKIVNRKRSANLRLRIININF